MTSRNAGKTAFHFKSYRANLFFWVEQGRLLSLCQVCNALGVPVGKIFVYFHPDSESGCSSVVTSNSNQWKQKV